MSAVASLAVALSTSWTVLGALAVAHATRRRAVPAAALPAVSVLKPLAGADPGLADNLRSFFEQDHPDLELVFGVERGDDPALGVVRALVAEHPHVRTKIVVHGVRDGLNPKVRNLRGMLAHASHDLVLVSDSNVRAPRSYVREAASLLASDPSIGLVTNLFAGVGEASFGARLECVQLSGFVASGAALPTSFGDAAVIGKSMLMSRSALARLGGLERVADVLAEDYVLGKAFEEAGMRVVVAPTVLENVVGPLGLRAVFDRQLRWSMMRARLRPAVFVLEPLTIPLLVAPLAFVCFGAWAGLWLLSMWLLRDAGGWLLLRGRQGIGAALVLGAARDLLALAVYVATPFKRHVRWRGHRVRVGAKTALSVD